jgi:hypothetical protein
VDTGVHANPDTQPGLLSATAIDGGSGDEIAPDGHGTTMAMIAGAAGKGMIGAWPQLKIVSVRATDVPTPGQEPTFQFPYYTRGIAQCLTQSAGFHVHAIDLALASTIPGSPDQTQDFASHVGAANGQNIAVVAAAGNQPGPAQEPAAEPGVLAVGAGTAQPNTVSMTDPGAPCGFSANKGLTLYAPGCGLDQADPFTDLVNPNTLGNGTSQASAFTAAVIVAMMSYDPALTYAKAEQLLVSTATNANLNVAAAFQADGLGSIVSAGNAAIPTPPPAPTPAASTPSTPATPAPTPSTGKAPHPGLVVLTSSWRRGVLTLAVSGLPAHGRLHVELDYVHRHPRRVLTSRERIRIHTGKPRQIVLRAFSGKSEVGTPTIAHVQ